MRVAEGSDLCTTLETEPQRLREQGCAYEAFVRVAAARILADASLEVDTLNKEEREAAQRMLAFYKSRRAKIDALISAIEEDLGEPQSSHTSLPVVRVPESAPARPYESVSVYLAALDVLRRVKKPMTTMEIAGAILTGGYETSSTRTKFNNTVYARLFTAQQKADAFERLPSQKWGLLEWRQKASA
jgi:hypothetical protein